VLGAVAPDQQRVVRQPDDHPIPQDPGEHAVRRPATALLDDLEDVGQRPAGRLVEPPPGEGFRRGVHERHVALDVGDDHGIADAAQRDPAELPLLAQDRAVAPREDPEPHRQQAGGDQGGEPEEVRRRGDRQGEGRWQHEVRGGEHREPGGGESRGEPPVPGARQDGHHQRQDRVSLGDGLQPHHHQEPGGHRASDEGDAERRREVVGGRRGG
jgi:hypothetical protein